MKLLYWLKQLLPLTYRRTYWKSNDEFHFAVWKMWFGRIFRVDDYCVIYDAELERRCIQAITAGDFGMAARMLLIMEEAQHIRNERVKAFVRDGQQTFENIPVGEPDTSDWDLAAYGDDSYLVSEDNYYRMSSGAPGLIIPGQVHFPLNEPVRFKTFNDEPNATGWFAVVTEVKHKNIADLTDEDAVAAGYYDAEVCRTAYQQDGIGPITIIYTQPS